jgi:hypothetical protein
MGSGLPVSAPNATPIRGVTLAATHAFLIRPGRAIREGAASSFVAGHTSPWPPGPPRHLINTAPRHRFRQPRRPWQPREPSTPREPGLGSLRRCSTSSCGGRRRSRRAGRPARPGGAAASGTSGTSTRAAARWPAGRRPGAPPCAAASPA